MKHPMKHAARLAALVAAAALTLTACGNGDDGASSARVPASASFNDADVTFATDMIPHHAQALTMVDLTHGRDLSPDFEKLAQQILDAQGPEIEEMKGWLVDWHQPVPETSRDHVNADSGNGGHGMGGMDNQDMPGMMSDSDLADLDHAGAMDFEDMWLRMMIQHHEGAIEMARTEQTDGEYPAAITLAEHIETAQQAEITQMKAMLAG